MQPVPFAKNNDAAGTEDSRCRTGYLREAKQNSLLSEFDRTYGEP
jgi:hypothetical protein